tara:strand:+ start:348 stop:509 length:162 start_codon:yes stop_codon:yes gene_type:complete
MNSMDVQADIVRLLSKIRRLQTEVYFLARKRDKLRKKERLSQQTGADHSKAVV